jgi:2-methylcitrate dehydratase PrpD
LIPTALAVAEKLNKSGSEMLTAIVVGYEVAMRTARCWHDYHDVYQSCGSWGSVADAAAAAHLLGLSAAHIRNALGIAEYHAPNLPMMRDVDHPTMVKHGMGWGTMTGITAVELAASGFTSIPTILSFDKYQDWVADIGENFLMVEGLTFKEFACCGWAHTAVLAAKSLKEQHAFDVEDISQIHIETFHESTRLGASLPTTTEEAQYRTGWPVAAMLLEDEIGPRQMRDERLTDNKLVALASKITMAESKVYSDLADKKYFGDPNGQYTSQVQISLHDGTVLNSGAVTTSHDYGAKRGEVELSTKFRWLVEGVITEKLADEVIEMVLAFETVPDVHDLTALLT